MIPRRHISAPHSQFALYLHLRLLSGSRGKRSVQTRVPYLAAMENLRKMINNRESIATIKDALTSSSLENLEFYVRTNEAAESEHGISEEGLALLADAICANGCSSSVQKELVVYGDGVQESGGASLAQIVRGSGISRIACFASSRLGEGAFALADALKSPSSRVEPLDALDLNFSLIGSAGGAALAHALDTSHAQLGRLSLRSTNLCEQVDGSPSMLAIETFAGMLRNNTTLRTLSLGQNGIDDDGATMLAEAITSNDSSSLTSLDLTGNDALGVRTRSAFDNLFRQRGEDAPPLKVVYDGNTVPKKPKMKPKRTGSKAKK